MPDTILPLLGIPATTEVWIRILGLLVVLLGYYYVIAAQKEIKDFFNATIPVRLVFFLGILVLVLTKVAYPILIIFGIIDLLGAIWTTWALRKE
jgi:hypothetical protein